MTLAPDEVQRFYRVWFALLRYVNAQRQILPAFPRNPEEEPMEPTDVMAVRDVLWANDVLRERFLDENPEGLGSEDLALIASWGYRVSGNFYILRHLKKHSVFLTEQEPSQAYGVVGLVSPIEDVVPPYLPVYVRAVLLPFGDRIIYDSLLFTYSVHFGPGIRGSLNDAYRDAQEREGVITTLLPSDMPRDPDKERKEMMARNGKLLTAFRKEMARSGLSAKMQEEHAGQIETFAQRYLLAQNPPRGVLTLTLADVQDYLDTARPPANRVSFKRFANFLYDTSRLDPDEAEALLRFLRHARD